MQLERKPRRSIEFFVRSESARTNAHCARFAREYASLIDKMMRDASHASLGNGNGTKLRKEITEAMGAIARVRRELREVDRSSRSRACVFDLCSGKGLLSATLATALASDGRTRVRAIDNDRRMVMDHLKTEDESVSFHCVDVFSLELEELVRAECEDEDVVVVVVGVHLCGDLSRRAIELFTKYRCDVLVLAPCCLVSEKRAIKRRYGEFGYGVRRAAKALKGRDGARSSSDLWCTLLYDTIPSHVDADFVRVHKTIDSDVDVLSEHRTFITARRGSNVAGACRSCE